MLGVQGHGALRGGEVPQSQGQAGGAAVNHTGVHKGGDGVELLSVSTGQDSGDAAGSRAEERHATLNAIPRIRRRNLRKEVDTEGKKKVFTYNKFCFICIYVYLHSATFCGDITHIITYVYCTTYYNFGRQFLPVSIQYSERKWNKCLMVMKVMSYFNVILSYN